MPLSDLGNTISEQDIGKYQEEVKKVGTGLAATSAINQSNIEELVNGTNSINAQTAKNAVTEAQAIKTTIEDLTDKTNEQTNKQSKEAIKKNFARQQKNNQLINVYYSQIVRNISKSMSEVNEIEVGEENAEQGTKIFGLEEDYPKLNQPKYIQGLIDEIKESVQTIERSVPPEFNYGRTFSNFYGDSNPSLDSLKAEVDKQEKNKSENEGDAAKGSASNKYKSGFTPKQYEDKIIKEFHDFIKKDVNKKITAETVTDIETNKTTNKGVVDPVRKGKITNYTPENTATRKIDNAQKRRNEQLPGSYKFFIEKLHGRSNDSLYMKNPVNGNITYRDAPNRMVFPTYLTAFNDSYDPDWEKYNFIGRGEPFHIWQGTTRSMQLSFIIMSDFSIELIKAALENAKERKQNRTSNANATREASNAGTSYEENLIRELKNGINHGSGTYDRYRIDQNDNRVGWVPGVTSGTPEQLYERATFLSQCVYGWYRNDGKLKEQPFIRLRLTDFFDVIARVDSLNMTEDSFDVDLNPSGTVGDVPMGIEVSMNLVILHEDEPNSEYREFYHRRNRDIGSDKESEKEQSGSETSIVGDSILDSEAQVMQNEQGIDKMSNAQIKLNENLNSVEKVSANLEKIQGDIKSPLKQNEKLNAQKAKELANSSAKIEKAKRDIEADSLSDKDIAEVEDSGLSKEIQSNAQTSSKLPKKEIDQVAKSGADLQTKGKLENGKLEGDFPKTKQGKKLFKGFG